MDELEGFEEPDAMQASAYFDMGMVEKWEAAGFTRDEAFQLLLAVKRTMVSVTIDNQGEQ